MTSILGDPDRLSYSDTATTPQTDEEFTRLDLYKTRGGDAALSRKRREDAIRATGHAPQIGL